MQSIQLAAPAPALAAHGNPPGLFELDGNADDEAITGADWANGPEGALASFFAGAESEAPANDTTYFTTGGSKDENDVPAWAITDTSVPDKDELLDAYAAVYQKDGDTWVYFGADRFDNDGTAQIGFWFFQNKVGIANGDFTGTHADGDVLILSEYTKGGVVSLICAYTWDGSGGGDNVTPAGGCDPATNGSNLNLVAAGVECDVADGTFQICAVSNTAVENAPWTFVNKDNLTDFGKGQFFEGGINLSDMFGNQPPCFGTFLAETRSSAETDAQLKDFALGSLNTCVPPVIATQSSVSAADFNQNVTDTATFSGSSGAVTGTATFFICTPGQTTGAGCPTGSGSQVGDAVTIASGSATSSAYTVGSTSAAVGTYCWRAVYTPDAASQYLAGSHTNATTECFTVAPAVIDINKVANPAGPVSAGDVIGFDITVTNTGTNTALNANVNDPLPAGVDWVLGTVTGGASCAINGPVGTEILTCTKASLASLASYSVRVTGTTDAADCGTVSNTGNVTTTNDGNDSSLATVGVQCPDVTVAKTPDNGSVNAGSNAVFTILVTNVGPGVARSVTLTDNLPVGYTWTLGGANAASCSIDTVPNPDVLSCNFGDLADDATRTITLSAPTSGANCAVIPNTAVVAATNEPAAANGNNSDNGSINVLCPDIDIDKVASPVGPVSAGDEIGFDIIVTNTGDGTATTVVATDNLPAGIVWTADLPTGNTTGVSCAIDTVPDPDVLTCTDASMAKNDTFTVHIHGFTDAADCGTVTNIASVTTGNDGLDSEDATVQVLCPDVTVLKTADNSPINAGDIAAYTITVSNAGPGTAKAVTLSDPLPAGISWSEDSAQCSIDTAPNPDVLTCTFGDLAALASRVIHLTGLTDSADCTTLPNTATVAATNEALAQQSNNTSSASIVVNCPDIEVVKDGNGPISAGENAIFTITLTNHGPGAATSVVLTDNLPAGIVWNLGGADAAACLIDDSGDPDVLTCDFGTLNANAIRTITLTGETDAPDCGTIPNTASAVASNEDTATDQFPNQDSASIVVNCPLIVITKSADDAVVNAGDQIGFTVTVTNTGAGSAFGVTVSDTLPLGPTWAISPASAGWSIVDGVLKFGPATLPADNAGTVAVNEGATSVHIIATTTSVDCGTIPNTAFLTYTGGSGDDNAEVDVQCPDITVIKSGNGPILNGATATFTITLTNQGPGDSYATTLTDQLPAGAWTLGGPDSADCAISLTNRLTCDFGTVEAPGSESSNSRTITVSKTATTADCGTIPNEVNVFSSNEDESDTDNNNDSATIIVRCPDTDIVKTANDDLVEPGQVVTFTLNVQVMQGPVTNAVVTDTLPVGQTYVVGSAVPAPFSVSVDGRTIIWKFASLATGNPSVTITYDIKIDSNATAARQVNVAQICVAEASVDCDSDDEDVTPQFPAINLIKTAGNAADGATFITEPGNVTYTYKVTNTGPLALSSVTVRDDAGTPANTADDFSATCPKTTLAPAESMTCTFTVSVVSNRTNIAVARGVTVGGNSVQDDDAAVVRILTHGLLIDKTNNAPIVTLLLPNGSTSDTPTAKEGTTVTYTLAYAFAGDPVSNAIITDVLPVGVTYVAGSASSAAPFTFQAYNAGTRTLTWTAATVAASGSVSYRATIDVGASELPQPLVNIAAIDSDQTARDDDDSRVFVPTVPLAATATPKPTLPPTDVLSAPQGTSNAGFTLMLILLVLAAVVLVVGFVTPVPASVRERSSRR